MNIGAAFTLIRNGASIKQTDSAGGIPITRIETIANRVIDRNHMGYADIYNGDKYSSYFLRDGDILMSHINSIQHLGKAAIYHPLDEKEKIIHGMNLLVLRANQKILDNQFAYFYFSSDSFLHKLPRITKKSVNQASFTVSELKKIDIPCPALSQQHKIANILSIIQTLCNKRNEQLKIFDELVKSRFLEMFGHSDRPKVRLGECCIINPKKSSDIRLVDNDLMVSFVSMSDVSEDGRIVTCNHKQYESVKSGFTYFSENDVLFAKITPCMENGKGGIAKGLLNGIGFGSTEFHVLRPVDQVSNSCWLYELTSFPQFRQAAEINMTGSAGQRRVPASFLANYKVSLPPISLQNQFADFVHQLDKSKMAVQKSLDELEILKKSLMQTYFG